MYISNPLIILKCILFYICIWYWLILFTFALFLFLSCLNTCLFFKLFHFLFIRNHLLNFLNLDLQRLFWFSFAHFLFLILSIRISSFLNFFFLLFHLVKNLVMFLIIMFNGWKIKWYVWYVDLLCIFILLLKEKYENFKNWWIYQFYFNSTDENHHR